MNGGKQIQKITLENILKKIKKNLDTKITHLKRTKQNKTKHKKTAQQKKKNQIKLKKK